MREFVARRGLRALQRVSAIRNAIMSRGSSGTAPQDRRLNLGHDADSRDVVVGESGEFHGAENSPLFKAYYSIPVRRRSVAGSSPFAATIFLSSASGTPA